MEIILKNIHKKFGNNTIFNNYNLEIKKGEMVAIVGKSGKGKTTLLNLIGLLDDDYTGEIFIQNKKILPKDYNTTKYFRYTLGYLFQNFALIDNMTVGENLDISLKYSKLLNKKEAKYEALSKVGLKNKLDSKIFELSGGEQQRVAIARLLLKPCDIILADEPTGSLDKENKLEIFNLLKQINKNGKTIITVTHDKEFESWCSKVIHI